MCERDRAKTVNIKRKPINYKRLKKHISDHDVKILFGGQFIPTVKLSKQINQ